MATEVYQLKVNGKEITLGKGSDAGDAFVSKKELRLSTICGFAYAPVKIADANVILVLPATRQFTSSLQNSLSKLNITDAQPWPILAVVPKSGNSLNPDIQYIGLPAANKVCYLTKEGKIVTESFQDVTVSFIWF